MTTPRLLPCPCCGGPAAYAEIEPSGWVIACTAPRACVTSAEIRYALGDDVKSQLAAAWNTRRPIAHSSLEVLRKVEHMAAYYEAPKGFFAWLDQQITQLGGIVSAPQPAGLFIEPAPAEQQEPSA